MSTFAVASLSWSETLSEPGASPASLSEFGDFVAPCGRGVSCLLASGEDDSSRGSAERRRGELRGGGESKGGGEPSEGGEPKSNSEGAGSVFPDPSSSFLRLPLDAWDMLSSEAPGSLGLLVTIGKPLSSYSRVTTKDSSDS